MLGSGQSLKDRQAGVSNAEGKMDVSVQGEKSYGDVVLVQPIAPLLISSRRGTYRNHV